MNIAILTISSLSLVVSTTTLAIVIIGGKRVQTEVEDVKSRTNSALRGFKHALNNLEF